MKKINIVIDFDIHNYDLHTDILCIVESNKYNLEDISIGNKPLVDKTNLVYINDCNSKLINELNNNYRIIILKNNFYINILKEDIINRKKILNFPSQDITFNNKNSIFYKKIKLNKNFSFFIRKDSNLIYKLRCFLDILTIYYDFEWKFNESIDNSINIHVLTPAKNDINGISVTQLIMSYQRNQFPISHIVEPEFNGLYISYLFSLDSLENLITSLSNGSLSLKTIKSLFNNHDFSNLFE